MAWNSWICDTRTGENRFRVNPSTFPWQQVLGAVGGGTTEFLLRDAATKALVTRESTTPLAKTLVIDWDGFVVYAGPIWARHYTFATGVLKLTHRDISSAFAKRLLVSNNSAGVEKTTLRIPAIGEPTVSKATLLKGIVFEGTDAESSMYRLPITYAADTLGSHARTYPGYNLTTVADGLQDVVEGDPNVDYCFQPEWNVNGFLRYVMRAGTLTGGTVEWNVSAEQSGAFDVIWQDDANKIANNVIAVGEGSGEDMKVGSYRDELSPYPAMEQVITFKKESNVARLNELAQEYVRVHSAPTEQWEMSMHAGGTPGVKDLKLGGTASLLVAGDDWLPDDGYRNRIIGFSGNLTQTVKLDFQPIGAS